MANRTLDLGRGRSVTNWIYSQIDCWYDVDNPEFTADDQMERKTWPLYGLQYFLQSFINHDTALIDWIGGVLCVGEFLLS